MTSHVVVKAGGAVERLAANFANVPFVAMETLVAIEAAETQADFVALSALVFRLLVVVAVGFQVSLVIAFVEELFAARRARVPGSRTRVVHFVMFAVKAVIGEEFAALGAYDGHVFVLRFVYAQVLLDFELFAANRARVALWNVFVD